MELTHTLLSHLSTHILTIATHAADIESNLLHIPPYLRFFTTTPDADPGLYLKQATMFVAAPIHTFISIPLIALFLDGRQGMKRKYGMWACGHTLALLWGTFWVLVSDVKCGGEGDGDVC